MLWVLTYGVVQYGIGKMAEDGKLYGGYTMSNGMTWNELMDEARELWHDVRWARKHQADSLYRGWDDYGVMAHGQ